MKQLPEKMRNCKLHTIIYTWQKTRGATSSWPTARWLCLCTLRSAERKEDVWERQRESSEKLRSWEALLPGHMSSRHLTEWFVETADTCTLPSFLIELQDLDLEPAKRAKEPRSVWRTSADCGALQSDIMLDQLFPRMSWWENCFIRSILLRMC